MTDGKSRLHKCLYCSLRGAHVINICRAVAQQAAATDDHQPFVSHFSLTFPFIKTPVHQGLYYQDSLWSTGRSRRAGGHHRVSTHQRRRLVSSHAVMWRWYRQIQMTPHQQLVALKLAILPLAAGLKLSGTIGLYSSVYWVKCGVSSTSSAQSERDFSSVGRTGTVTDMRTRLNENTAKALKLLRWRMRAGLISNQ